MWRPLLWRPVLWRPVLWGSLLWRLELRAVHERAAAERAEDRRLRHATLERTSAARSAECPPPCARIRSRLALLDLSVVRSRVGEHNRIADGGSAGGGVAHPVVIGNQHILSLDDGVRAESASLELQREMSIAGSDIPPILYHPNDAKRPAGIGAVRKERDLPAAFVAQVRRKSALTLRIAIDDRRKRRGGASIAPHKKRARDRHATHASKDVHGCRLSKLGASECLEAVAGRSVAGTPRIATREVSGKALVLHLQNARPAFQLTF